MIDYNFCRYVKDLDFRQLLTSDVSGKKNVEYSL